MRRYRCISAVTLVVLFSAGVCLAGNAESLDDLKKENAQLSGRVDKLERELGEIRELLRTQIARKSNSPKEGSKRLVKEDWLEIHRLIRKEAESRSRKGITIGSDLDVELYGYVKLDASYDTAQTSVGNFARWVAPEGGGGHDDQFNMTARETRLGMKIKGPDVGSAKTSGRVELDFYGGGIENKPEPRMRHAYMNIEWPERRFSILAGQTWDVFSPLYPDTLNFTIAWWTGNIGWRRPQIRVTKGFKVSEDVDVKLEGAVARTIGHSGFYEEDSGEDAGFPGIQGRASVTFPFLGDKPTTIGFSGHAAGEEFDTSSEDNHDNLRSWSANLDVTTPVNRWLTIKGEMFTGSNLDAYLGGIGQGIDAVTLREIDSCGGWLAASLGPWDRWRFNVGAAIEAINPEGVTMGDAATGETRTLNRMIFGNVLYEVNKNAYVGFELSHWMTRYKHLSDGDSFRFQTSFIYKF